MTQLIEVKARCDDWAEMHARLSEQATTSPVEVRQDDTFFACTNGRLKLRELAPDRGRLIFYVRGDGAGAKQTDFLVSKTDSPATLRGCLAQAYGVLGRVQKSRTVFDLGSVRAHLDQVAGLGSFVELEIVLEGEVDAARGEALIAAAMSTLAIQSDELLSGSYLDMLLGREP